MNENTDFAAEAGDARKMIDEVGTDPAKWAEAFCQVYPQANVTGAVLEGWFECAMAATQNEISRNIIKTIFPEGEDHDE